MNRPPAVTAIIALILACSVARAAQKIEGGVLLFDFEDGDTGWRTNVYGKGEMTTGTDANAAVGAAAMAVHCRGPQGANLISPPIPFREPWRLLKYDRARFRAKADEPMTKAVLVFVTDEAKHPTYNLHFVMDTPGWQQHVYPLSRCWNRGNSALWTRGVVTWVRQHASPATRTKARPTSCSCPKSRPPSSPAKTPSCARRSSPGGSSACPSCRASFSARTSRPWSG